MSADDNDSDDLDRADARLIAEIVVGNTAALAQLYDRHATRLRWVAFGILRKHADADDLVHDVFLEAWRRAGDYNPARGTVRRWLVIRAWSRAIDRITQDRERREAREQMDFFDQVAAPPGAGAGTDVERALATLTADQRRLLGLVYVAGLTMTEVAGALAIPIGTVKSRLSSALAKLRELLRGDG